MAYRRVTARDKPAAFYRLPAVPRIVSRTETVQMWTIKTASSANTTRRFVTKPVLRF